MKEPSSDDGTIQALLDRLNNWRLPRALELKDRVDKGEKLSGHDIEFLERVFEDSKEAKRLVSRHPELQSLAARLAGLYAHITQKALENEKAS